MLEVLCTLIASANIPKLTKIMNLLALKLKSNYLYYWMLYYWMLSGPPSGEYIKFIDRLTLIIQELKSDQSIIDLGGDGNLDLLKYKRLVTFFSPTVEYSMVINLVSGNTIPQV